MIYIHFFKSIVYFTALTRYHAIPHLLTKAHLYKKWLFSFITRMHSSLIKLTTVLCYPFHNHIILKFLVLCYFTIGWIESGSKQVYHNTEPLCKGKKDLNRHKTLQKVKNPPPPVKGCDVDSARRGSRAPNSFPSPLCHPVLRAALGRRKSVCWV